MPPKTFPPTVSPHQSSLSKYQDLTCPVCGHRWHGTTSVCPNCHGIAKSEGEVTHKVMDEPDLKKGL